MKKIELLAPAKDYTCGVEAIKFGTDALYIGAESFGARKSAGNSIEDISRLVDFAHKYYVKVYVTVNTILKDDELPSVKKLIEDLYARNIDGIIIQDYSILMLDLPPIPFIASTQMHSYTLERINFLEKSGLKRVILPRELSLEEIHDISKNVDIELEAFVHGALCVSYSGQCYMSYAIGGRSANRGECAQPCRKAYLLKDSDGTIIHPEAYLLSLKDLCLSNYIEDLINAGITSFKIEGRLKDINYVRNIVAFYRQQIDKVLARLSILKSSSGKIEYDFIPDTSKTFNRGFTSYFLTKPVDTLSTVISPKSIGEELGVITKVERDYIKLNTEKDLVAGDGLCFLTKDNALQGASVNKIINDKIYLSSRLCLSVGIIVYRNYNKVFNDYLNTSKTKRKIVVDIVVFQEGDFYVFQAEDSDGVVLKIPYKPCGEFAKNSELFFQKIEEQMKKSGDTIFEVKDVVLDIEDAYFIPVSEINSIRRRLLKTLEEKRLEQYQRETRLLVDNSFSYPEKLLDFTANVYNQKAKDFYIQRGVENIELAAESQTTTMCDRVIMTSKYCLRRQLNKCLKNSVQRIAKKDWFLIDDRGKSYTLKFDCKNCLMEITF